jgi:hypothetical protein
MVGHSTAVGSSCSVGGLLEGALNEGDETLSYISCLLHKNGDIIGISLYRGTGAINLRKRVKMCARIQGRSRLVSGKVGMMMRLLPIPDSMSIN